MKLISYNCFAQLHGDILSRTSKITEKLLDEDVDIICLQEIALDSQKKIIINNMSEKYNIYFSEHTEREYSKWCYSYFLILLGIIYFYLHNITSILLKFLILGITIISIPNIFDKIICKYLQKNGLTEAIDTMGLTVLIKKKYHSRLLEFKPFNVQGYKFNKNIIRHMFNTIMLRPGYTFIEVINGDKKILLCNCHLVTKYNNKNRIQQVNEIIENILIYNKITKYEDIIVCGDFNSENFTPEISIMKKYLYNTSYSNTWVPSVNKYAKITTDELKDNQYDYIFSNKNYISKVIFNTEDETFSDHYGLIMDF